MITTDVERPGTLSRIVREGDRLVSIVEGTDAPTSMRAIHEVGTNWIAFRRDDLFRALPLVGRENAQAEYYLNDVFPILIDKGERVSVVKVDTGGAIGINSRADLARTTRVVRERINARHLANGVTLDDPDTTYIDVDVRIGRDHRGPSDDVPVGRNEDREGLRDRAGHADRRRIGGRGRGRRVLGCAGVADRCSRAGGSLRARPPRDQLGADTKVGAFVEVKASDIGEGGKVPHLTYVGDAKIGRRANLGAGTVTVNYDGYRKHRTQIGDDARVGSDTMLVAPVKLGKGAVTGAGSVITSDVPAGALAVERSSSGWCGGTASAGTPKRRVARPARGPQGKSDTGARGKRKGAH